MNGDEEKMVEVGDDTPPIREQARSKGWACDFFDFGKAAADNVEFFNPGLVRRPDGLWLLVRRSEIVPGLWFGHNGIWACKLDDTKKPLGGPTLKFRDSKSDEQFEDPRAVYWNGQTWIVCVNFTWFTNGSWTGAHQMLGVFQDKGGTDITEETWTCLARRDPVVGTNLGHTGHTGGKHNKNVLFWFVDDKLHCLYTSDPWVVVEFGSKWEDQIEHVAEGVKWNYGIIRGGTPPVQVGDYFFTFFHSSLPWRGRYRRYYMGALAFQAKAPFTPVLWTREPILVGSQNDYWQQRKPLVVFPCGAVMENGKWLVTLGVNDLKSAWIEIPHNDLFNALQPIPTLPGLELLSQATEKPEYEPIPYEENLSGVVEGHEDKGNGDKASPPERDTDSAAVTVDREPTASSTVGKAQAHLSPIGSENQTSPAQTPSNGSDDTLSGEQAIRLQNRQAAAKNAREALAAKRALGLVTRKKGKKYRKRKALKSKG